jgi:hypothetical protein
MGAQAAPIFCTDLTFTPDRMLTGCPTSAGPALPMAAASRENTQRYANLDTMERIFPPKPRQPQLFQVGRRALVEDRLENEHNAASQGLPSEKRAPGREKRENQFGLDSQSLSQDGRWHYMNIDDEGNYIFFGDSDRRDSDEPGAILEDEDLLPGGFGIGKKWRF